MQKKIDIGLSDELRASRKIEAFAAHSSLTRIAVQEMPTIATAAAPLQEVSTILDGVK
jgi:hypothetical protein